MLQNQSFIQLTIQRYLFHKIGVKRKPKYILHTIDGQTRKEKQKQNLESHQLKKKKKFENSSTDFYEAMHVRAKLKERKQISSSLASSYDYETFFYFVLEKTKILAILCSFLECQNEKSLL